jgi:hypothetical protein
MIVQSNLDQTIKIENSPDNQKDNTLLDDGDPIVKRRMVTIDPKDLIGRTFLKDSEAEGQRFWARVFQAITEKDEDMKKGPEYLRFICEVTNYNVDEILTYNEFLDHINKVNSEIDINTEQLYKFQQISAHQGPLQPLDKDYKGSAYKVLMEWETGE